MVDARKENDRTKDRDIHVCFKKKDETCPSLTPDGKYLFFSRYNEEGGLSNIYWVSAEVIDKLRTAHFVGEQ